MKQAIISSLFKRGVIKRNQEFKDSDLIKLFKKNKFKFGQFLIDVHEILEIDDLEFDFINPFNTFQTFDDVFMYFEEALGKKELVTF